MGKASSKKFYAVKQGHLPGIYTRWADAEQQISGFSKATHRGFTTRDEAEEYLGQSGEITSGSSASNVSHSHIIGSSSLEDLSVRQTKPVVGKNTSLSKPKNVHDDLATSDDWMAVYADGSCIGNGRNGAKAGSGVHWLRPNDNGDISERLPGKQTNQCAELYAIVRVLQSDPHPDKPLVIHTDSKYTISCLCEWVGGWLKRDWRNASGKPVENKELIHYTYALFQQRPGPVKFKWVPGHAGLLGNETADKLACQGAGMPSVKEVDWRTEMQKLGKSAPWTSTVSCTVDLTAPFRLTGSTNLSNISSELDEDWLLSPEEEEAMTCDQEF